MYADHMPLLRDHGRTSARGFADLVTFACLSIRQHFASVPENYRATALGERRYLWGRKAETYEAAHGALGRDIWRDLTGQGLWPQEAMECVMRLPGLGLAKSAFVCQMLGYNVACLDSRNLERLGMNAERWHLRKKRTMKAATLRRHIDDYVTFTQETGGAEHYWDTWCEGFAPLYTGQEVSAMHLVALEPSMKGRPWKRIASLAK